MKLKYYLIFYKTKIAVDMAGSPLRAFSLEEADVLIRHICGSKSEIKYYKKAEMYGEII